MLCLWIFCIQHRVLIERRACNVSDNWERKGPAFGEFVSYGSSFILESFRTGEIEKECQLQQTYYRVPYANIYCIEVISGWERSIESVVS